MGLAARIKIRLIQIIASAGSMPSSRQTHNSAHSTADRHSSRPMFSARSRQPQLREHPPSKLLPDLTELSQASLQETNRSEVHVPIFRRAERKVTRSLQCLS